MEGRPKDSAKAAEVLAQVEQLERAAEAFRSVPGPDLVQAWWRATDDLVHRLPAHLRRSMATATGLSARGLEAGLGLVVRGVRTDAAAELLLSPPPRRPLAPALAVLSSNLPGLALQCLLPSMAARRPLLLKTPSAEPDFTPWLAANLTAADRRLENSLTVASWRGGDRAVEDDLLPRFDRIVAYGSDGSLRDLSRRARPARVVDHGHRISLGLVMVTPGSQGLNLEQVARGLARDVALFDQRGCLSVHSVLVVGSPELAVQLATFVRNELAALAVDLPPGAAAAGDLAALRAARDQALMAGHQVLDIPPGLSLRHGSVVVLSERGMDMALLESPGMRSVRFLPIPSIRLLWQLLGAWHGRLQGIALVGGSSEVETRLRRLGVTRIAQPGQLQEVDTAVWCNGGTEPLAAYAGS